MCPKLTLVVAVALVASACSAGEAGDTTSMATTTSSAEPTSAPTTEPPPTTSASTTTLPEPPVPGEVEALAWGLLCRNLEAAGWDYEAAVTYWNAEGRPARMDTDENGIPCETVYPAVDVVAYWGDPLPAGLQPGPGTGWRSSTREVPVTAACCSMNSNGPESPPLPPESGPYPDDGAFAVRVERAEGDTDSLLLEIRRWLPCSEQPDQCSPDLFPGDVYVDPGDSVTRTLRLDENVLVVINPIVDVVEGIWTDKPIEGDGAAFGRLLKRIDAAVALVAPTFGTVDLADAGKADPTFPYGPAAGEDVEWVLAYRGPENASLTTGLYTLIGIEDPSWMPGWWYSFEVADGIPILHVWAGQIAG